MKHIVLRRIAVVTTALLILVNQMSYLYAFGWDKVKSANGCVLIIPKCKLQIKQSKFSLDLGGVTFASGTPISSTGTVKVSTDLLQKMTDIAQILDQAQFSECQLRASLTTCDPERAKIIATQEKVSFQLYTLALLAQMYSGNADKLQEALLKWIAGSADFLAKLGQSAATAATPNAIASQRKIVEALTFAADKLHVDPASLSSASTDQLTPAALR